MIRDEIVRQAWLFAYAFLVGAGLLFLYDILRIIRRILKHGTVAVAVEDLFFWLFSAIGLFGFMYRENEGVIRGFLILGAAFGMLFYTVFCSRRIVRGGTALFRGVLSLVGKICFTVSAPFRFLGRVFGCRIRRFYRFQKKIHRSIKKQLKKAGKAVRMGISKL